MDQWFRVHPSQNRSAKKTTRKKNSRPNKCLPPYTESCAQSLNDEEEGSLQEHISFEIVASANTIQFYVWTPKHLKDFVESQIYAQYPSVQIREGADDYTKVGDGAGVIYGTELHLTKSEVIPIKTFASFEVDPLAGITAVLAKLDAAGEQAWIQVLSRPTDDSWHEKGKKYIADVKAGKQASWGQGLTQDGFRSSRIYR